MSRYHWAFVGFISIGLIIAISTTSDIKVIESEMNPTATKISNTTPNISTPKSTQVVPNTQSTSKQTTAAEQNSQLINPIDRLMARSQKTELHQSVISEHKNFKRYPPENHRFETPEQDPVTQRYAVDERSTINEDHTFGLTIWSDQKFYLQGDSVNVYAYVQNKDGQKLQAEYEAFLVFNNQTLAPVDFIDEDKDGTYQGVIDLSQIQSGTFQPGIYKVLITTPQHNITDAITFTLSQPDIGLTGDMRDFVSEEGHLTIEIEVEVSSSQPFYFQASLYSVTGVPIGVTQASHTLAPGKHWVPLTYSGLMVRDSNESGPYVLQQVSLAKVTMPMQRAPALYPEYQTEPYGLDEFSNTPYEQN